MHVNIFVVKNLLKLSKQQIIQIVYKLYKTVLFNIFACFLLRTDSDKRSIHFADRVLYPKQRLGLGHYDTLAEPETRR